MFALVAAAMAIGNAFERQAKLAAIGPYRSRGKGRGAPSRRYGNACTHWKGRATGAREAARRLRQIAAGTLRVPA